MSPPHVVAAPVGLFMMYRVRAKTVDPDLDTQIVRHALPKSIQRCASPSSGIRAP